MSLQPQAVYVVPEDTARVARAAFPQGLCWLLAPSDVIFWHSRRTNATR